MGSAERSRLVSRKPSTRHLHRLFHPVGRAASFIGRTVASCSFITLHHAYFLITVLVVSGIFYGISTPAGSVKYIDCLFLVTSAMTETGLNTVNLSTVNTAQQVILFLLIIFGSSIFVSSSVVFVRKNAFEHRFAHLATERQHKAENRAAARRRRMSNRSGADSRDNIRALHATAQNSVEPSPVPRHISAESTSLDASLQSPKTHEILNNHSGSESHTISSHDGVRSIADQSPASHIQFPFLPAHGVGARSTAVRSRISHSSATLNNEPLDVPLDAGSHSPQFSPSSISRNSQFHHLSEKERTQLGGYEYKAIKLLSWLVPGYFVIFQFLGSLGLGSYVARNRASTALENGLNPWWVGSFNAVSAFNNSGMSLLDANMVAFQDSVYMLITMSFLILAGNTCFPIFLRLIVWTFVKLTPQGERWEDKRRTLQFLLDHPRRCYTNMFPSKHTWWLLFAVITLNSVDWAAFELLNIGNNLIDALPKGIRVLDGLFQAFAVRSGGFYVVPISSVRISLQVLYVIMMYISVYPVVITIRNTNPYEERSLGIYADDPDYLENKTKSKRGFFARLLKTTTPFDETTQYFVRHQLRAQLSHDLWGLVLAVFVIMCFEASNFERLPAVYSVFNVIFETVSAYGCVGISVGLPDQAYSFAGSMHTCSKLVLCVVMLRGRHRGLPVAIDKAVMLPREGADEAEEDDAQIRLERSASRGWAV